MTFGNDGCPDDKSSQMRVAFINRLIVFCSFLCCFFTPLYTTIKLYSLVVHLLPVANDIIWLWFRSKRLLRGSVSSWTLRVIRIVASLSNGRNSPARTARKEVKVTNLTFAHRAFLPQSAAIRCDAVTIYNDDRATRRRREPRYQNSSHHKEGHSFCPRI